MNDFKQYLQSKGKTNQTITSYEKSLRHLKLWLKKEQIKSSKPLTTTC